jgi:hypothetical protein
MYSITDFFHVWTTQNVFILMSHNIVEYLSVVVHMNVENAMDTCMLVAIEALRQIDGCQSIHRSLERRCEVRKRVHSFLKNDVRS